MMMGIVAALIVVMGVAFVVLLAATGGDDDSSSSPDNGNDGNDSTPSSTGSGICSAQKLITFGSQPLSALDPIQTRDAGTAVYMVEIFGGLVTLAPDPTAPGGIAVQGDIAESWEISPDGRTYTFTLRDNVVFHNGTRVTADDVKYSLDRATDPANASPTASLYLADIVGFNDRFRGTAPDLAGVTVIDDRTVQIQIIEPASFFLSELTYPVAFVVDQDQIERSPREWTKNPNGTGPFKFKTYQPAEKFVLVKNDRYHLGAPMLEEIVFELAGGSIIARYENNELHVGLLPPGEIDAIRDGTSELGAEYHATNQMAFFYIALNTNQPPFDDVKVRQALAMSVNREEINDALFFNLIRIADGILPPETPGYQESISSLPYDPERARQLLSESRYADDMPRITLTYGGSAGNSPGSLEVYKDQWEDELGIEVELTVVDRAAYQREVRLRKFQMFSSGWVADYPHPEVFLDKLFYSGSEQNESGYNNPEVDALLEAARYESDEVIRTKLYGEAEQLILDDVAVIPTFWDVDHVLVKPCVTGWIDAPLIVPRYRFIEIVPE